MPDLAAAAMTEAGRMRAGRDNRVTAEADGRPSATVVHRPTDRGALMVAHELGHAVHAVMAMGTEPPGALVGETVACWASLVAGRAAVARAMASGDRAATVAAAMALGDMLVEEVFVSAAISSFEDRLYGAVAQAAPPPMPWVNGGPTPTRRCSVAPSPCPTTPAPGGPACPRWPSGRVMRSPIPGPHCWPWRRRRRCTRPPCRTTRG